MGIQLHELQQGKRREENHYLYIAHTNIKLALSMTVDCRCDKNVSYIKKNRLTREKEGEKKNDFE